MKKRILCFILSLVMVISLAACNQGSTSSSGESAASDAATSAESTDASEDESSAEDVDTESSEEPVVSTYGPEDATHLEMWLFASIHEEFYSKMLEQWNSTHEADEQLNITFTTYPFSDMHNKLQMSIQAGSGAPDMVDIEINQFPNFLTGQTVPFREMNDVVEEYKKDVVESRLDAYSKDGKYYGIPTHVGATVMYYNTKVLEEYGIDYTTIKTWDDFTAAGEKLKEASNGEVYMTAVDSGGTDWLWLSMAEHGEDWTNDEGVANVQIDSIKNMLNLQQGWVNDGIATISAGGQLDCDAGFGMVSSGKIAAFPKAMWYMSRFKTYMPEMTDTWAIAPCPNFKEGQPRSVGIGGTGTVVMADSPNADLAAKFLAWAKLSYDGNVEIWKLLGFDPCNTSIWGDQELTQDKSNWYIGFFVNNPFDTLNEIKGEIESIKVRSITPTINDQFNLIALNNILENGADIDSELQTAQDEIDLEQ